MIGVGIGITRRRGNSGGGPIITGTSPVLAALTAGDTLTSATTWGTYATSAGGASIVSPTTKEMSINGAARVAYDGATVAADGTTYRLFEIVTDTAANTREFSSTIQTAVHVAPVAAGALADVTYTQDTGDQTVNAAADFTGQAITYSLVSAPAGVTINSGTGVVTIPTTAILTLASIVVRGANSGGQADTAFSVTVEEAAAGPVLSEATWDAGTTTLSFTLNAPATIYYLATDSAALVGGAGIEAAVTAADDDVFGTFAALSGTNDEAISLANLATGTWYLHAIAKDGSTYSDEIVFEFAYIGADVGFVGSAVAINSTSSASTYTGAVTYTPIGAKHNAILALVFATANDLASNVDSATFTDITFGSRAMTPVSYGYTSNNRSLFGAAILHDVPAADAGVVALTMNHSQFALTCLVIELDRVTEDSPLNEIVNGGSADVTTIEMGGSTTADGSMVFNMVILDQRVNALSDIAISNYTEVHKGFTGTSNGSDHRYAVSRVGVPAAATAVSETFTWTGSTRLKRAVLEIKKR